MQQLSIFDYQKNNVITKRFEDMTLKEVMLLYGFSSICIGYGKFIWFNGNDFGSTFHEFPKNENYLITTDKRTYVDDKLEFIFTKFDVDGKGLFCKVNAKVERHSIWEPHYYSWITIPDEKMEISEWKPIKKLITDYNCLNTKEELYEILLKTNPYCIDFIKENNMFNEADLIMAPHLEILAKAGFEFVYSLSANGDRNEKTLELFNRLCQRGTKPKTIFKTSKIIYNTLKSEKDLTIWDAYRKLDKFGRIDADSVVQSYNNGFKAQELSQVNDILNKTYEGKPVFTWDTLMNYLQRVDMYEAIEKKEAFILLRDYLTMCQQLGAKPKIDGDSLKREHDVMARTCRQKRNEILAKKMDKVCRDNEIYNYEEDVFFVRAIKDYDDLINEATQQHNCVASYGERIANKTSLIFVMREKNHPNKSLITIELSPDGKTIRQKYLAYNKPIHNKAQTEFIERWFSYCKTIKA